MSQQTLQLHDYDFVLIDSMPFAAGYPPIKAVPFAGLQPGDLVTDIGHLSKNGKITSSKRVDTYTPWVEYMGIFTVIPPGFEEMTDYAVFKLPPGGLVDRKTGEPEKRPYYALYAIIDETEIVRQVYGPKGGRILIFKTTFRLYDGKIITS